MADNVEIQGLEFQIQEDSAQAVDGLENLSATLERLKTATSGGVSGLNTTAKQLQKLNTALSGLSGSGEKLTSLANGLKALGEVGNVRVSSSIANQLTSLGTALNNIKWTDGDKIVTLANGLKPLSELGKANLTTFINQLGKLPAVIEELEKADIDKFTRQMTALAAAMKPFADEMQKVSNGFSAFPSRIQRLIASTDRYNGTVRTAAKRTGLFGKALDGLKTVGFAISLRKLSDLISDAITKSNKYQEDLNLFTVAMGQYAEQALEYGRTVSEVLGIDLSDWIRNQGIFNTLMTGFGNTADRAQLMSRNLTQLGYDLSSFFNIPVADAMQKLQSGMAGELEPLRRLGYDLSQTRLQMIAYNLGIEKKIQNMTQAEKAELRYYAIMTQVTTAQGDLARTLEAPANQLRVLEAQFSMCAREIGNIFIPALNAILPYAIAVVQVIRKIAAAIAALVGFKMTEVDYSGVNTLASGAGAAADSLDNAAGAAKKLKQYTAGFDELNVFAPDQSSGAGAGAGVGGGNGFDFQLPEYDFLGDAAKTRIEEVKKQLEGLLPTIGAIGVAIAAWNVGKGLLMALKMLKELRPKNLSFKIDFPVLGLAMFLADMKEFERYLKDFMENGATFQNVAGMISEFAGMVGDACIVLGNLKLGGALKVVQGIGEIAVAIKDISENGVNWENALTAVRGLTNLAIGIELLTGNIKAAGWTVAIQGLTVVIREIATNWDAIKQGDWSGVDKVALIVGGLEILGGLVVALDVFSKLKGISSLGNATAAVETVTTATGNLDTTVSTGLSPRLTSLAKNLGMGVLILGEVAAAAIIFAGAIAILGHELDEVGKAWQPVIENGATVAAGIGLGTVVLGGVGLAAYALGTGGATIAVNVGLGTAILLELGVAAGLFIVEIWAIGKGLDEIGQAWQPVLDNGETIAAAIGLGTALLVGIGVVTAALGAATVASAGLLPVAVGLGTAILVELAVAFVAFTESIVTVADELKDNLAPALRRLNPTLPQLRSDAADFADGMSALAGEISGYTDSMGSITWDSIVSGFQRLFAGNPIGDFADDVATIAADTASLNAELRIANPELRNAVALLTEYATLMKQLGILTQDNGTSNLATGIFTNLQVCGEQLVTGFATGMSNKMSLITNKVTQLKTSLNTGFNTLVNEVVQKWNTGLTTMNTNFTSFHTSTTSGFTQFKTEMISGMTQFANTFPVSWNNMWRGMGNTAITQWNAALSAMEKGMNNAVTALNNLIREINKISVFTGVSFSYARSVTVAKIPYMAQGGFVNEGQLFIAREAGAEMVGAIGHKTTVANNDQIVEGISAGVSIANDGVIAAIYALLSVVEDKDLSVSIGDEVVGRAYDRYNRHRGVRVNSGAFANSY